MINRFSRFVAYRNFAQSRHTILVSFISALAMLGLVLGVALLVTVISVMNGFDHEMETRILGQVPHIKLFKNTPLDEWHSAAAAIARHPKVTSVEPYVAIDGMLSSRGKAVPVKLEGLRFLHNESVGELLGTTVAETTVGNHGVYLSAGVAEQLQLQRGDYTTVIIPGDASAGSGQGGYRAHRVEVAGVFSTRTSLDEFLLIGDLDNVARLAGMPDQVQGLQVTVENVLDARRTGYQLLRELPGEYRFSDWLQSHGHLYQAIQMSRNLVSLLVFLVIGLAVFNVVSMLVMSVVDKKSAIAIYKTLGATRREVMMVFILQGVLIGLVGTLLGELAGLFLAFNLDQMVAFIEWVLGRRLLDTSVYPVDFLPVKVLWQDLVLIALIAFLLTFAATLYPAWKAAQTQPAKVLSDD